MPSVLDAVRRVRRRRRAGHHRASARRRSGTSRRDDVRDDRGRAARRSRAASSSTSRATRGPDLLALVHEVRPDQCTLVPVQPGEITSQAGWPPDTPRAGLGGDRRDLQSRRRAREPVRRSRAGRRPLGARPRRRSRRALHRAVRARVRTRARCGGRRASRPTPRPRDWRTRCGLGVNAGHDLDLAEPARCSARCRTSTKCRSATRSSATRSLSVSLGRQGLSRRPEA